MRSIVCPAFGPLDTLELVESPSPALFPGCVRIDVSACGVNYVDALFVQGKYQIKPPTPFVPGMEVVGRISEIASDVTGCTLGDRVFANVGLGGYSSEVVVSAKRIVHIPESLTDGRAATFMQSYLTAWFALVERARVAADRWLLVLGAGGGVGLAAVDVGRSLGLNVIGVASTQDKRDAALERGAVEVIDALLDPAEVKEEAKRISGGGVDYLYDPVGGSLGATCLRALTDDGQYLVVGFVAGIPDLPANQILLRNRRVTGVDWGGWAGRNPEANDAILAEVLERIDSGDLSPVEPVSYPLSDAARALHDLESRKISGKVALIP
jgi:NADPH2:quinone reductase